MADFDWGSLASAFIPAVIGGALGGGRGAALGAAGGLAEYGRESEREQTRQDKLRQQEMVDAREQQRIKLEERRVSAMEERDRLLNQQAGLTMEQHKLQMKKLEGELADVSLSREAADKFRETLPEDRRAEFDVVRRNPAELNKYMESYRKRREEESSAASAGGFLESAGIVPRGRGAEWVRTFGSHAAAAMIEHDYASRHRQPSWHMIMSPDGSGNFLQYDSTTGQYRQGTIQGMQRRLTPQQRVATENALLNHWKATHPLESKFAEGSEDFSAFHTWRNSAEGQLEERILNGDITPQEAQRMRPVIQQQTKDIHQRADQWMRQKTPGQWTPEQWQKYLESDKGASARMGYREEYKRWLLAGRDPLKEDVTGKAPVPMQQGKDQAVLQPKTDAQGRPSLDDIFGR